MLAARTVTVVARVIAVTFLATVRTAVDVTTQGLGATRLDGTHGLVMAGRHPLAVLLPIGWPVLAEDLGQRHHVMFAIT